MAQENILIVEDDKHISNLVKYNLEKTGYKCFTTFSGEDALATLNLKSFDLIILDIMLPEIDGFETCKRIKQNKRTSAIPIIMLTAKGEEIDRVLGFELGADDYVVKPFSPRELVLRVKAILKRNKNDKTPEEIIKIKDLTIDIPRHKIMVNNNNIILTKLEFKLLLLLIERKGRVQTREKLLADVWDIAADVTTRTIDTHIKRLRQKLGPSGHYLETIRGIGYKFSETI
jgi:two-component system, OmpR family, phosphate regulon response regulator PhoB